jgi:CubicO group peptidase (beta-lactamase class C family)
MKAILLSLLATAVGYSQISEAELDDVVGRTMKAFNVPGIAVGIVKDGQLVMAKGYGVSNINTGAKTDANTLFGIASNSKAFTSAALAQLVDQGKIEWDDKVRKHLPEFTMYNDYVSSEFTIRDLLTHRSGLGLGAGDLMIWPDGHDFTPKDVVANIRHLKPVSDFRAKYDYDNLLYVIAGEVIAKVSGMSWAEYVEKNLMQPIGMTRSAASWNRLKDTTNVVAPHVPTNGKLKVISRYKNPIMDAAAGLYASVNDLSKWVIAQLNAGEYQGGKLFSREQHREMWTPQTIMPLRGTAPYRTNFKTYGLGWQLTDVNSSLQVSHTGGLEGIVTQVIMIPELKLGIIVLTNQQSGAAFNAISNTIKDRYLGLSNPDHVTTLSADRRLKEDDADRITTEVWETVAKNLKDKKKKDTRKIAGTYLDNWLGAVEITQKNGKWRFASKRSPALSGEVFWYKDDNYVVKWDNRSLDADSHIFAEFDADGTMKRFTMKAISPLTDFSYDFHDLEFVRK